MTVTVSDVVAALERAYPPELAESWDAVGLVCGDPAEPVHTVLVCVDPTSETVDEAVRLGADMVIAHHPLLLRGVHGVPADAPKGRLVHRLVRNHIALLCAHTNADAAEPGVSDALAGTLGLAVTGPLVPREDGRTGLGRICVLDERESLAAFVRRVAARLPETVPGVRASGHADRPIRTVAVCGGAGDAAMEHAVAAGVDAYVTADLRHHPAGEHMERGADVPALVDVTHWASEWPWCAQAADVVRNAVGGTVDVRVSSMRTDPWTLWSSGAPTDSGRS